MLYLVSVCCSRVFLDFPGLMTKCSKIPNLLHSLSFAEWRNDCNWIGLSYTYFNGWSWVDGTPLDSYLWDRSDGQPDNSDGTSCGCECNFNSGQDQGLHDCRCSLSGAYSICERPLECPLSVGN